MSNADEAKSIETSNVRSIAFATSRVCVDKFLERLMNIGKLGTGFTSTITENEIFDLCCEAKQLFLRQPVHLDLCAPIVICGDIHGQFADLIRMFKVVGFPPCENFLFLGDYIDRGQWSIETILFLLCIKLKFPDHFMLLRGNHETNVVNRIYGFYDDITKRFGKPTLYNAFSDIFEVMPLTACVGSRILCMHGGISAELLNSPTLDILGKHVRPLPDPPVGSLAIDLLWADPAVNVKGFLPNIRGCSVTFGEDSVAQVCTKFKIDLIVRAHQVVQDGYDFFANRKLVTIFSAPHYCGQFDNAAAALCVDANLSCSFKILRPQFPGRATAKTNEITCYKKI